MINKMKVITNKMKVITISVAALLVFTAIGVTYAYFTANGTGSESVSTIKVSGGSMSIAFAGTSSNIEIANAVPQAAPIGTKTFTVTGNNTTDLKMYYEVSLVVETNTFSNGSLTYSLTGTNTSSNGTVISAKTNESIATGASTISLGTGYFNKGTAKVHTYSLNINFLRTESDQNVEQGHRISAHVVISPALEPGDTSGANVPLLADNMIPVYYDETKDIWKKANSTNPSGTNNWYNYDNQKWANAVTVTSGTRTTYNSAAVGTEIPMNDIVGMWVWIPRFEYKIDNPGLSTTAEEIHVNYISGTDTTTTSNYLIHPAFRNGTVYKYAKDYDLGGWDKELTGFWYGKFETGYITAFTKKPGIITSGLLIKPDVYSINYQNISTEYATAQNIQTDHGIGNTLETHMSKNDEWGAVAYLSNSKYGKFGNTDYTGANKEIYVNNAYYNYSFTTGRSNGTYGSGTGAVDSEFGTYEYNNCPAVSHTTTVCNLNIRQTNATKGTGASTTGNIYGVYDMAGGINEYTMGVLEYNTNYIYTGYNSSYNSGFTGYYEKTLLNGVAVPPSKFYNRYTSTNLSTACNGVACPGIGWSNETGNNTTGGIFNWNNDNMYLSTSTSPWVKRGGCSIDSASDSVGAFANYFSDGSVQNLIGFRVVGA